MVSTNGSTVRIPKWLVGIASGILTASVLGSAGLIWGLNDQMSAIERRVSVIEGNRFTATEMRELQMELPNRREIDALTITIQSLADDVRELRRAIREGP